MQGAAVLPVDRGEAFGRVDGSSVTPPTVRRGNEIARQQGAFTRRLLPVSNSVEVSVRRVGFRDGTDAELACLHAVEVPIEVERGSNRMPAAFESYIAFARNLPSQFSDHAWLVEAVDGTPVAVGYCWSTSAGDERLVECDVLVSRDRRREGIGARLMALICDETLSDGRTLLTWSTFDRVPAAEAFSQSLGARVARVNRTSELALWASTGQPCTGGQQPNRPVSRLRTRAGRWPGPAALARRRRNLPQHHADGTT